MYYDINAEQILSDTQINNMGLTLEQLYEQSIYPLVIEKPEYDIELEGIEPDGPPAPMADNPYKFIQRMRVYSLLDWHKTAKKSEVTNLRWSIETGGIILPNGSRILTGTSDQNRIATAIQGMRDTGLTSVDFKAASGWVTLTLEELMNIAALITAHVQACFTQERRLHEAIDACMTLDELNDLNVYKGWPNSVDDTEEQLKETLEEVTTGNYELTEA